MFLYVINYGWLKYSASVRMPLTGLWSQYCDTISRYLKISQTFLIKLLRPEVDSR